MRDSVTKLAHKITEIPCHFAHSLCISGNFLVALKAAWSVFVSIFTQWSGPRISPRAPVLSLSITLPLRYGSTWSDWRYAHCWGWASDYGI